RLRWVHGLSAPPEWELPWTTLTISQSFVGLGFGSGINPPQLGSTVRVDLSWQGSALMSAVARKVAGTQYLWTCHQIGVNHAGNNDYPQTNPADRSAIAWYKIQTTPSVTIGDTGRIYDNAATNPKFYFMPSVTVNKNGDMVVGFSGSSANDYVGAYYTG